MLGSDDGAQGGAEVMGPLANAVQRFCASVLLENAHVTAIELDESGYDALEAEITKHYGQGVMLPLVQDELRDLHLYCAYGAVKIRKAASLRLVK